MRDFRAVTGEFEMCGEHSLFSFLEPVKVSSAPIECGSSVFGHSNLTVK